MTRVGRRLLSFGMLVPLLAVAGAAQNSPASPLPSPGDTPQLQPNRHAQVTEAEVRSALQDVEELASHLQYELKSYRERLKQARERYGRGFNDPAYKQKLAGFDQDIQTGDLDETEQMKAALFAAMMNTAGVRLDPDPFRYWAEIEKDLARYDGRIDNARDLMAQANTFNVKSEENIPSKVLRKLKSQWLAALKQAEKQRQKAEAARPARLRPNQIFEVRAIDGPNLHFRVFGVEFGREMTNVGALAQLTYSGKTSAGDVFLLTVLSARYDKTRVDTLVKPRAVLVYSDARDPLRYGYAVTTHDYHGYVVISARVGEVAASVRDWIWKTLAQPDAPVPSLAELEQKIRGVQESRRAMDQAFEAFQRMTARAVKQNDEALKAAAKLLHRKLRLPEQDLRGSFSEVRAQLYAIRALIAGDPMLIEALDMVAERRRQAQMRIDEGRELFGYFNRIPVDAAPGHPWRKIEDLGSDFMGAAEDVRRTGVLSDRFLPRVLMEGETAITALPPELVVAQINRGPQRDGDSAIRFVEHILRDVHWSIKGVERREYTSELIQTSTAGVHQVQSVLGPDYIQGPGGLLQVFQHLSENGLPDPRTP